MSRLKTGLRYLAIVLLGLVFLVGLAWLTMYAILLFGELTGGEG